MGASSSNQSGVAGTNKCHTVKCEIQCCILESDVIFEVSGSFLGKGSFGVVRRGSWLGLPVAIKTLGAGAVEAEPSLLASFNDELSMLAALRHPNIIAYFGNQRRLGPRTVVHRLAPTKRAGRVRTTRRFAGACGSGRGKWEHVWGGFLVSGVFQASLTHPQ